MANIFTGMVNNLGAWLGAQIAPYINDQLGGGYSVLGRYYKGDHRAQLKVKVGTQDENIVQNFVGLAVDRSVSRLFRGGVKFNLPEGADAQQEYLDAVWDLNKKEIILYQVGLHGAVYGTTYFKICPDELTDPYTGKTFPRLIPLDPEIIRVQVEAHDMNDVKEYRIEYTANETREERQVAVSHREITRHSKSDDYGVDEDGEGVKETPDTWMIEEWEQVGGGMWTLVEKVEWPYNFPNIIHWKNLPSLKSCYGDSDIDDAINVQDKSNFVVSNTGKIIKFHAHPETIGTGFSVKDMQNFDAAVGSFHAIPNADAKVFNLEMGSDLASSRAFANDLRQSIFDISREVDISSMSDKLGALTNFGLHVLYTDALDKNNTKRQLYADALLELNRRLLVIAGYEMMDSYPGWIKWGEAMITNVIEDMQADQLALGMGIIDRETLTNKYADRYGVDFDTVQVNLAKEAARTSAASADIGATILRNFNQGR